MAEDEAAAVLLFDLGHTTGDAGPAARRALGVAGVDRYCRRARCLCPVLAAIEHPSPSRSAPSAASREVAQMPDDASGCRPFRSSARSSSARPFPRLRQTACRWMSIPRWSPKWVSLVKKTVMSRRAKWLTARRPTTSGSSVCRAGAEWASSSASVGAWGRGARRTRSIFTGLPSALDAACPRLPASTVGLPAALEFQIDLAQQAGRRATRREACGWNCRCRNAGTAHRGWPERRGLLAAGHCRRCRVARVMGSGLMPSRFSSASMNRMSNSALWITSRESPMKSRNWPQICAKTGLSRRNSSDSPWTAQGFRRHVAFRVDVEAKLIVGRDVVDHLDAADFHDAMPHQGIEARSFQCRGRFHAWGSAWLSGE